MRLAADLREALYLSALNGSLSERKPGEKTEQFHSSFTDEEPFSIPNNWKWCYFSDVVTIATNLVDPKEYQDYLQIAPDYIEKGTGILKPCNTVKANKIISKNHLFRAGQIIYSKIRPALRKAVIAPFDGLCSADMYPLETELNTHYLLFFLLSDFFTKKAVEKSAREKMPKINQKELGKLPIPVPPVEEQQRIVERVKELLPEINEYEEMENRLVALKEAFPKNMRDAILQAAVLGQLTEQKAEDGDANILYEEICQQKEAQIMCGLAKKNKLLQAIDIRSIQFEIPNNWRWAYLQDIVNIRSASRVHQSDWRPQGIPFYRAREIVKLAKEGFVNNELYITDELYNSFKTNCGVPEPGDLMVSGVGTLGATYIVKETDRFYYKDASVLCFENRYGMVSEYLKYLLESPLLYSQIYDRSAFGTTVATLTMDRAYAFIIPIPPIAEQYRIVDLLNTILPLCDALTEEI